FPGRAASARARLAAAVPAVGRAWAPDCRRREPTPHAGLLWPRIARESGVARERGRRADDREGLAYAPPLRRGAYRPRIGHRLTSRDPGASLDRRRLHHLPSRGRL